MGNVDSKNLGPKKATVFQHHDHDWFYRIPALFYESESKTLVAFAEQRETTDDASTKHLVMKTMVMDSSDVKMTEWSELKVVDQAHIDGYRPMNPCPVYEKNSKTLFLFFICVKGTVSEQYQIRTGDNQTRLCYITSKDLGQSWSSVTDLTDELVKSKNWATFAVGPGHGLQAESGRLIVPTYAYAPCSPSSSCIICRYFTPYALDLYSDDQGKNWKFGGTLQTKSVECEMAEVCDDKGLRSIYCNARREGGYRVEALDENGGAGFIILPPAKKLVETGRGCQGSVVSFPAQSEDAKSLGDASPNNPNKWLLFTHPSDKSKRINLGVHLNKSPRDPNGWSKPWIINSGPSGYSDLAYIDDGRFACLLECGEKKETEQIASVVFNYSEVKQGVGVRN